MTSLNKKQVNHLKKIAHHEKPIFQMGKEGLGQSFLDQVDQALTKRELIKFKVLQNSEEEIREVTAEIAYALDAHVVQVIGQACSTDLLILLSIRNYRLILKKSSKTMPTFGLT